MSNQRKIVLNAKQLRVSRPAEKDIKTIKRQPISIILDNILDTFNIGSFFRLADAIAAEKLYLCGKTVTPPNIKIHRSSIGAWRWVPWEQHRSATEVIKKLNQQNYLTVAAEQTKNSIAYTKLKIKAPLALVIGNESRGVNKKILKEVDKVIELPLLGVNKSLNVLVAASVILYHWLEKMERSENASF